jgi:hypothetical protein
VSEKMHTGSGFVPTRYIQLKQIECLEQEDYWGVDHVYLKVNDAATEVGQRWIWGIRAMRDGEKVDLYDVKPLGVGPNGQIALSLYERDDDGDDWLGTAFIKGDEAAPPARFTMDDVVYLVDYEVVTTS